MFEIIQDGYMPARYLSRCKKRAKLLLCSHCGF
jgi:hypothetical protein